jgi:hypothetical protein
VPFDFGVQFVPYFGGQRHRGRNVPGAELVGQGRDVVTDRKATRERLQRPAQIDVPLPCVGGMPGRQLAQLASGTFPFLATLCPTGVDSLRE